MGFPRARSNGNNATGAGGSPHKTRTTMKRFEPPVTLDPTTWPDAIPEPFVCIGENCDNPVFKEGDLCEECQICIAEHRND